MAKLEVSYFVIKPIVSMPSPGLTGPHDHESRRKYPEVGERS